MSYAGCFMIRNLPKIFYKLCPELIQHAHHSPLLIWLSEASILIMRVAGTVMVSRVSSSIIWFRRIN